MKNVLLLGTFVFFALTIFYVSTPNGYRTLVDYFNPVEVPSTPPSPFADTSDISSEDLSLAYDVYVGEPTLPTPTTPTPEPETPPAIVRVATPLFGDRGVQGSQGATGPQGPQGPAGPQGLSGTSVDTSLFITKSFLDTQVSRIYDSLNNSTSGLSTSLSESINTELLTVGGNATVDGAVTASYFNATSSVVLKQNETLMFHNNKPVGSDGFNTSLGFQAGNVLSSVTIGTSTDGSYNTFLGSKSGLVNTTGKYNTFTGTNSGLSNTTGFINAFFGMNSGQANTTGNNNSFFGMNSGRNNITGSDNTFLGMAAGRENTEGSYNTFVGLGAGYFNSTGAYNTYLGYESGRTGTTGIENTFVGMYSGREITTGANNTFLGSNAGRSTTTANFNVMIGSSSGFENLTGADNVFIGQSAGRLGTDSSSNVFVGRESGMNNTGNGGTYVGIYSGTANTSGLHNTLLGGYAGADITEGGTNTFVGFDAGRGVTTGVGNTIIGANVEGLVAGLTNNIILANGAGGIKAQHDGTDWSFTGKVGIGTTPTQALTVGDGTSSLFSNVHTTNSNIFIGESGNTRFGYAGGAAGLIFQSDATALAMGTFGGGNFTLGTNNNAVITMTVIGNVGIGITDPGSQKLNVQGNIAAPLALFFNDGNSADREGITIQVGADDAAGTNVAMRFKDGDGTEQGSITFSGGTTAYNTSSDIRLKENIQDTGLGLVELMNIEVKDYHFKSDTENKLRTGFIAQQLYEIFPDAVTIPSKVDGYWSVDYGKLTPLLVKGVQEINLKITDIHNFEKENNWRDSLIAWFGNASNRITRIFTGEVCLTEPGQESVCLNRAEVQSLKALIGGSQALQTSSDSDDTSDTQNSADETVPETENSDIDNTKEEVTAPSETLEEAVEVKEES